MRNYNYQHEDSECAGNFQISKVYVRLRAKSVNFFSLGPIHFIENKTYF